MAPTVLESPTDVAGELPIGDAHIFIDNSNLWIAGQRTYAERMGLQVSWDPTWRSDIEWLCTVILQNSNLTPEEQQYDVKVNLYGSIPPPVDTFWKKIDSYNVRVSVLARSTWTKKEKQVDAKLVAECVKTAAEAHFKEIPSVFIIVSGDRDVHAAIQTIAGDYSHKVHLWA
ncbi:uncharacterized protein CTHT_0017900 [Thermochaetoides thermophila DSM 1495]|uniref:Uncharacterized protein n=1 Tax=Chaetomium thermophilum (strain DSM 1495 / CBS 144.50 / IMI 039719) TaxID=759272 RepID=G0S2N8_CHATD|nr:hypothetical protein CTHT_0017900 [Thermochaetoides thermophila DSM 1495]EGS22271.1 hypothetical protein CTHT_0017900 [Thermochaetoides thermophila DSM 1495]